MRNEINTLERKVKILLTEYNRLKSELVDYRAENQELKGLIQTQKVEINSFHNKFKISKLVDNMVTVGDDPDELKSVLDQYISEIDKCIAHLSEA